MTVGREGRSTDIRITAAPDGKGDHVWGSYIVTFEFYASATERDSRQLRLFNFPRRAGTDGLASLLLRVMGNAANGDCTDPTRQDGTPPAMPSVAEQQARPVTFEPWPPPAVSVEMAKAAVG